MSNQAYIGLDVDRVVGTIDPLVFGGFLEHLGRAVYQGVYWPGSPLSDHRGFRKDVMAALRELGFTTMRYPGGNFVSNYNWLHGVGPRQYRPRRPDLAWRSIETNQFGTDEFMDLAREMNWEPMLAVNLGTAGVREAIDYLDYCNGEGGTDLSDYRKRNGHEQPHNIKLWCLGNEMDGPWQTGVMKAEDYGKLAYRTSLAMKSYDKTIKTIAAGSSGQFMPAFPDWDRTVLEECWETIDYLSMHCYVGNEVNKTPEFLAVPIELQKQVDALVGTIKYVKAKKRSKKDVYLSWDEWNVWYRARSVQEHWCEAPRLLEEVYNLEDALVVAQWMSLMFRNCRYIKAACIAQVVNVIAPILVEAHGILKQTIFYPFAMMRPSAGHAALDVLLRSPTYDGGKHGPAEMLDVSATLGEVTAGERKMCVYVCNRSTSQTLETTIDTRGALASVTSAQQVSGTDPKAFNSFTTPEAVVAKGIELPAVKGGRVVMSVPPMSFTAIYGVVKAPVVG